MVRADLAVKLIENSFMFNLKQLKICDTFYEWEETPDLLLNDTRLINQLVNLEVLEVSQLSPGYVSDPLQLEVDLPNLKHLAINRFHGSRIQLNCPKLLSFKTKMFDYNKYDYQEKDWFSLDFLHPLSVTHLYVQTFYCQKDAAIDFKKLHNLQQLIITSFDLRRATVKETRQLSRKTFLDFPSLRKISVQPMSLSYSQSRATFVSFLKARSALKRTDMTLKFHGIQIEDELQLKYHENVHHPPTINFSIYCI